MRFIFILAMFVALLFLPGVSPAASIQDCQKKCSTELADIAAKCPPAGKDTDKERAKCLKDADSDLKDCREACVKLSTWEAPKDEPMDEPESKPTDTPPVVSPDAPE